MPRWVRMDESDEKDAMKKRRIIRELSVGPSELKPHIDPDSVRKIHIKAYKVQLSGLNKANEKMRHYLEVDQPAFSLWWQKAFNAELLEHIDLEKTYNDLQLLIDSIEQYRMHYGVTYLEASTVVSKAHAEGKLGDLMRKIFEEIDALRKKVAGHSRRQTQSHTKASEPEDFFQSLFEDLNEERDEDRSDRRDPRRGSRELPEDKTDDYLKKIYKDLVRQLHPDATSGREQTLEEKSLWHELQNAYEWRDMERIEKIFHAVNGKGAIAIDFLTIPIGDIVAMRESLEKNLKSVNKSIRDAKKAPVWDFTQKSKKRSFLKYLSQTFQEELEEQTMMYETRIDVLREQLEKWRSDRKTRRKSK